MTAAEEGKGFLLSAPSSLGASRSSQITKSSSPSRSAHGAGGQEPSSPTSPCKPPPQIQVGTRSPKGVYAPGRSIGCPLGRMA